MLRSEAVSLLVSLSASTSINDMNYTGLLQLFDHHFGAKNEVAEAYVFDTRMQSPTESVSDFILALKALSTHCNFRPTEQLNKSYETGLWLVSGLPQSDKH